MKQEFLAAIGSVVVKFALLEQQLDATIWSLLVGPTLEAQAAGRLVTAARSSRDNLDLLSGFVRHRFPGRDESDLVALCSRVSQAAEKRNLIVHSNWAFSDGDKFMGIKTTRKGAVTFNELALSDVNEIAVEIHAAAEMVLNFHLSLLDPGHTPVTL